jgi:threonine/homoserine/homoserine lactone efflux protein
VIAPLMLPLDSLATFAVASILLDLAPGPDNIFVLTQSALYGRRAGILVTLGLCTGLLVHTSLVAFGAAALLQASPGAFTALKVVGALYLLYLAWGAFRAGAAAIPGDGRTGLTAWQYYRRGIIMNVTNPKVSVFFLAFLPQFAEPSRGPLGAQIVLLGAIFIVLVVFIFGGIAILAGTLGDWLRRSVRVQLLLNRLAGTVFVLLALRLLVPA